MVENIEIRGGAGEFEAAVIAVVLDRLAEEDKAVKRNPPRSPGLPAWVRALEPDDPTHPLDHPR